ncbi:uncharacterized protein [Epargyreus clarus]|uniref:uncharacterized protein n=1 Tax=Epargyreus clarus TaxID=520877 RepID=UPI003C2BA6EB
MKFRQQMESILITITAILCTILLLKLLFNLRAALVWRVNCWFCNSNFWVKFLNRNSWVCPKCEQYNGFTKDGDYNKVLNSSIDHSCKSPKVFQRSPPRNGLCKMCNINQQLKVTQLANFVPMNDNNYDHEIDNYRLQLEKAYKLCSPCKKVLQMKLHKEKETLLGSKLLETRTPERKNQKEKENQDNRLRNFVNSTSASIAGALVILVALECYSNAMKHKNLSSTIYNIKEIVYSLLERIINIVKMKTLLTFPTLENYNDIKNTMNLDMLESFNTGLNDMAQKALAGCVCLIQIIGIIQNTNKLKYTISIDLLWFVFVVASLMHRDVPVEPLFMSLIKLASTSAVFLVYRHMTTKTGKLTKNVMRKPISPRKMKNLVNGTVNSKISNEDNVSSDTDDDVSLSKFGLHNLTESSNETISPVNKSLFNGRSFTPRTDSVWGKPKLNSTFCVNSALGSPTPLSDTVFIKPSFNRYQKLTKDDSDSDLDESISSLCISSPKKRVSNKNSIFTLRKFTASPNFVTPMPMNRARPLISPSKLGHSTSWVAGGYWGSEGDRQIFNINGSRSSSQSSGFESQASSMNQRNIFSQPPSREESDCGEPDRTSMLLDRFQNCNTSNFNFQNPQSFTPISSPVFPQMQYNNHVQIPQPQFAQQTFAPQNMFGQQQFAPNNMFKAPGGSRLIKLPQVNSFTSR